MWGLASGGREHSNTGVNIRQSLAALEVPGQCIAMQLCLAFLFITESIGRLGVRSTPLVK